jgi:GT2 family glycosyltransferase/glycosyltransferase involved in cell wall biosynthesis
MIIIGYSFAHFHPVHKPIPVGSAGLIAKAIYDEAVKFAGEDDVLYLDPDMPETWGLADSAEALISRASNYSSLLKHFKPQKNLLIAVNQHPSKRKTIRKQLNKKKLPAIALDATDGVFESSKQIYEASKVLVVGNGVTRQTYLENSFHSRNVYPLTYAPALIDFDYKAKEASKKILAHIGSIGFRKGADILFEVADMLRGSDSEFKLLITGEPVNEYWHEELKKALARNPNHLEHLGWVDIKSEEFKVVLAETRFAIFPTREEGLSGAFLEIAVTGLPVLTTDQVGLETLDQLVSPLEKVFVENVRNLLEMTDAEIEAISDFSKSWFKAITDSSGQLPEAVNRFLHSGRIWPEVDIKLCVHNKSQSIASLVSGLSKSASLTDNTTITAIDDGSTDQSYREMAESLQKAKGFRESKLLVLPDVFEVKSNNAAINATSADYHVIVQDDNHLVNYDLLPEMIALADKCRNIAALGGLAGANFYPLNPDCQEHFPGQHACGEFEHYWRQDKETDSKLASMYFEVDAVMRGPLLMSDKALREIGYLDERYAPLYMDDVEWCARARIQNWKVFAMLGGVVNRSETMANASDAQNRIYRDAYQRNTKRFYSNYEVSDEKNQLKVSRFTWANSSTPTFVRLKHILIPEIRILPKTARLMIYLKFPTMAHLMQKIKHFLVQK